MLRNTPTFSMAVDFADVDRDGFDDFFVADMLDPRHEFRIAQSLGSMAEPGDFESLLARPQLGRNVLQRNRGDGTFAELAQFAGLEATGWTWSLAFVDLDLDGYEDLLAAGGHQFDTQDRDAQERIDAAGPYRQDQIPGKLLGYPPLFAPLAAFRNRGQLRFEDVGSLWIASNEAAVWQGLALADLDGDGDADMAVNRLNAPAVLLRNTGTAPRVAVRLAGKGPNTRGIGARIELLDGPVPRQSQTLAAGGRYLSSDDPMRTFAAASTSSTLRLEVRWPLGGRSVIPDVRPNHLYVVDENDATPAPPESAARTKPAIPALFADESALLGHRHYEAPFDDFDRQPLLPRRQSRRGPGVGWIDLDGDGREDLFVAAGKGGRPGVFLNAGQGAFRLVEPPPARLDQVAVAVWNDGRGPARALVAPSPYEKASPGDPVAVGAAGRDGEPSDVPELRVSGPGPLAVADVDGDGDLDLFVGGTAVGGRYPESERSTLWLRQAEGWRHDAGHDPVLSEVALANAALWADLDSDGFPELVVACEWGPIRIFANGRGRLREITRELGLEGLRGWWTGVEAADVDGDGRLDLIAGNWGWNSDYRATPAHPVRLHFGDLAGL
ncbi:MAG: VCBS repeat-containing protein, partial [Verrucomicrobiales bacterium]|nr:VCBS repeat-containing protein [Verrucomicrobiales bacterium]